MPSPALTPEELAEANGLTPEELAEANAPAAPVIPISVSIRPPADMATNPAYQQTDAETARGNRIQNRVNDLLAQHADNVDDAANHHADLPQEQAVQKLRAADQLGVGPEANQDFLDGLRETRQTDDLRKVYADSPALAQVAAMPGMAAVIGPDAKPLSMWEAWVTGPSDAKGESLGNGLILAELTAGVTQLHLGLQDKWFAELADTVANAVASSGVFPSMDTGGKTGSLFEPSAWDEMNKQEALARSASEEAQHQKQI